MNNLKWNKARCFSNVFYRHSLACLKLFHGIQFINFIDTFDDTLDDIEERIWQDYE